MTSPTAYALPRTFPLTLAFISGVVALAVSAPAKEKLRAVVVIAHAGVEADGGPK